MAEANGNPGQKAFRGRGKGEGSKRKGRNVRTGKFQRREAESRV